MGQEGLLDVSGVRLSAGLEFQGVASCGPGMNIPKPPRVRGDPSVHRTVGPLFRKRPFGERLMHLDITHVRSHLAAVGTHDRYCFGFVDDVGSSPVRPRPILDRCVRTKYRIIKRLVLNPQRPDSVPIPCLGPH